ncbi:hypothetical protein M9458_026349, partial [Cirrhinus mrigala]
PSCLEFGPGDSKVILKPRHGYVPKVPSTPFRAQVITLSALPSSEEDQKLNLLCPVRALRTYIERSLFASVAAIKDIRWIVDAIRLAYSSLGLQCPIGAWPPLGRGLAVYPLQKFVRRPAGPRRPPSLGSTTWTSPPYRRVSFCIMELVLCMSELH